MPYSSHRMQRLRRKLGYVRHGVTSRVATTFSSIRDKSYAYAGFPVSRLSPEEQDPAEPHSSTRYMPLTSNTTVRYVTLGFLHPKQGTCAQLSAAVPVVGSRDSAWGLVGCSGAK
jgi:hypothetical protein